MSLYSPNRSIPHLNNSLALERSLTLSKSRREIRKSFLWGALNFLILAILLYDLSYSCPLYHDFYDYVKYGFLLITCLNFLYYAAKIMIFNFRREQIPITLEQKRLLKINDNDPSFKIVSNLNTSGQTPSHSSTPDNSQSLPSSSTPMNITAHSWRSNLSPNESLNYSLSSPSWSYHKIPSDTNSPSFSPTSPIANTQYRDTSGIDFITDEKDLNKYLKEFEMNSSIKSLNNQTQQPSNLLSSFWSHPVAQTAKDMSCFLRKCAYQLSTQSPTNSSSSPKNKTENKASPTTSHPSALVPWTGINVDIVTLTQWNENLRKWVSQTILDRLVREFDKINESFEKHGLTDMKVGSVGLDRLRKTAQITHVTHFIPSLSTLIPFLEITSNQEYLVKRIRELARGGCMSEFKWNGGSSYNGKEWDESLPTDSTIIMHLLASYLDTQLMPLPSMPDTKPFSGLYYIKCKDKLPSLTPSSLFIQQVSEKPPHFRVIVGETVYDMVKGYNNLLHSVLFFLYHVNKQEHGMLGRVNLGRAGVNMLWIIGQ